MPEEVRVETSMEIGHPYLSNYADTCKIAEGKPLTKTHWNMKNLSYNFSELNSEQCFDLNSIIKSPFDKLENVCKLVLMKGLYSMKSIRQKNLEKVLKKKHETLTVCTVWNDPK